MHSFSLSDGSLYKLTPLTADEIDEAIILCDECVGENLYSREEFANTIDSKDRFFYFLRTDEDKIIGYVYFYLADKQDIVKYAKLESLLERDGSESVGSIRSAGLKEDFRGIGLADEMMRYALKRLSQLSVKEVFVVCWKPGGSVPIKRAVLASGFKFLTESKMIWYDYEDLICPYCHGRCTCDAEVYYKSLEGEVINEA